MSIAVPLPHSGRRAMAPLLAVSDAIAAILDQTTLAMVCEKVDSAREKQGDSTGLMYYI